MPLLKEAHKARTEKVVAWGGRGGGGGRKRQKENMWSPLQGGSILFPAIETGANPNCPKADRHESALPLPPFVFMCIVSVYRYIWVFMCAKSLSFYRRRQRRTYVGIDDNDRVYGCRFKLSSVFINLLSIHELNHEPSCSHPLGTADVIFCSVSFRWG